MATAYVYNLSYHWMVRQTERPIRAGMKALILRCYIITARMLNRSFRDMVDSLPAYMLLKQVVSEEGRYRTVEFHNRRFGFPGECERVVHLLQRFQRSYLPKQTTQESKCWSLSPASVSYDYHGAIKEISYGMVVMVREALWSCCSCMLKDIAEMLPLHKQLKRVVVSDGCRCRTVEFHNSSLDVSKDSETVICLLHGTQRSLQAKKIRCSNYATG